MNLTRKFVKCGLMSVFLLMLSCSFALAETITLTTTVNPESPIIKNMIQFYKEAFKKAGLDIDVKQAPLATALKDADEGLTAGNMFRTQTALEEGGFENLVAIPVIAGMASYSAYTAKEMTYNSVADLKPYRVAVWKGNAIVLKALQDNNAADKIVYADDTKSVLNLLLEDKADVAAATDSVAMMLLQTPDFKNKGIKNVGLVSAVPLYIMINKKYESHAPKIAEVIKEMMLDGTFKKMTGFDPTIK